MTLVGRLSDLTNSAALVHPHDTFRISKTLIVRKCDLFSDDLTYFLSVQREIESLAC
jgi:hypothetical protein